MTIWTIAALLACGRKGEDTSPPSPSDTATDTAPPVDTADTGEPLAAGLTGSFTLPELGLTGTVDIQKAYGLAVGDQLIVYLSNNANASCARVVEHLSTEEPLDPSDLLIGGTCDIFLSLHDLKGGHLEAEDDLIAVVSSVINCPLGEGAFLYEERSKGFFDYYWTGRWWQGYPDTFRLEVDTTADGYDLSLRMETVKGSLPYEDLALYAGEGLVEGRLTVERCEAFQPLFDIFH